MIKKGSINDKTSIMSMIRAVVADMEANGIYQWDSIYPNEEVIENDLNEGQLYVFVEDNNIKSIMVLNTNQDREYEEVDWKYNSGEQLVVHRLCIDPQFQRQGVANKLMAFAEEYGMEMHYEAIRLDTFSKNYRALGFYKKLGYERVGTITFRKGQFYCYEKKL